MKIALFGHEDAADRMLNMLLQQVPACSSHMQWAEKYISVLLSAMYSGHLLESQTYGN